MGRRYNTRYMKNKSNKENRPDWVDITFCKGVCCASVWDNKDRFYAEGIEGRKLKFTRYGKG